MEIVEKCDDITYTAIARCHTSRVAPRVPGQFLWDYLKKEKNCIETYHSEYKGIIEIRHYSWHYRLFYLVSHPVTLAVKGFKWPFQNLSIQCDPKSKKQNKTKKCWKTEDSKCCGCRVIMGDFDFPWHGTTYLSINILPVGAFRNFKHWKSLLYTRSERTTALAPPTTVEHCAMH